ncbi:hypothetical protein ACIQ1J_31550 [Streptomyces sp. NPDC097107]|uniref:hypothetical protein n=1 Tax=Streptomyces sp. NPDC097107 TaxID=3366089 RepID=UPI00381455A7
MPGVFTVVVAGGPRLADVLHGGAGSAFGAREAVAGGGLLVGLVMPALAAAVPALRRYRVRRDLTGSRARATRSAP